MANERTFTNDKGVIGEAGEYWPWKKKDEGGGGGGGAVSSVNGKTGAVVLNAEDVGALPDDTPIPAAVTEQTVSGWGFTKNTGTYSKPSGGIPKSDLASAVQESLLPVVDASDNDKFLRVENGAWAAVTVPSAETAIF